mgnify:CR=1 FL=1
MPTPLTPAEIRRHIIRACPDARVLIADATEACFRSWSFSKDMRGGRQEYARECDMLAELRRLMPGWDWMRGDKNFFDGWRR